MVGMGDVPAIGKEVSSPPLVLEWVEWVGMCWVAAGELRSCLELRVVWEHMSLQVG